MTGVVEAKKLTVGPQNVLTQAERYARGLRRSQYNFDGLRAPFLYSTNGEVIWFHDVRHPLNRSRRVGDFHTLNALREMLDRDHDAVSGRLLEARCSVTMWPEARIRAERLTRVAEHACVAAVPISVVVTHVVAA